MFLINGLANGEEQILNNRSFQYGEGLFETIRCIKGNIIAWRYHWARLSAGLNRLHIPSDGLESALLQDIDYLLAQYTKSDCVIKLHISTNSPIRGYRASQIAVQRVVSIAEYPHNAAYAHKLAADLMISDVLLAQQPLLAGLKHCNRLENVLAAQQLKASFDDAILLDTEKQVISAISANVFMVLDGQLVTPELAKSGVAGTQRQRLIDNFPVVIQPITLNVLLSAQAVFLTNAIMGVWPVASINGQPFDINHKLLQSIKTWVAAQYD